MQRTQRVVSLAEKSHNESAQNLYFVENFAQPWAFLVDEVNGDFFVVPACHELVLDGSINIFKLSTL